MCAHQAISQADPHTTGPKPVYPSVPKLSRLKRVTPLSRTDGQVLLPHYLARTLSSPTACAIRDTSGYETKSCRGCNVYRTRQHHLHRYCHDPEVELQRVERDSISETPWVRRSETPTYATSVPSHRDPPSSSDRGTIVYHARVPDTWIGGNPSMIVVRASAVCNSIALWPALVRK